MAHTLLYTMGYNAPEDALLPQNFDWKDEGRLHEALKTMTHVAASVDYRFSRCPERCNCKRQRLARQDWTPLSAR